VRLFIAVNFDDSIKSRLLDLQGLIKNQSIRGNFSRPENLHLTLVFIGETPSALVPTIISVIRNIPANQKVFSVTLSNTGCFRHSGKELWWIGAEGKEVGALVKLRLHICDGLEAASVPFDKRPFNAHITLGREIKPSTPIIVPERQITFPVKRISLMKSEHIGGTLVYTEIAGQDLLEDYIMNQPGSLDNAKLPG
jgi:2'-5' RNA ligase